MRNYHIYSTDELESQIQPQANQSEKELLIKSVLANSSSFLSAEQLRLLENEMLKSFNNIEFARATTSLSVDVDQTEKLLKLFIAEYKLKGRSENTIKNYLWIIKAFLERVNKPILDITRDDVKYYLLTESTAKGWSPSYMVTIGRYLGQLFTFLHNEGYIARNPIRGICIAEPPKKEIVYLSDDEIVKIQDAAKTLEEKAVLNVCLSTGCRVGEILKMQIDDVNFIERTISVISEKSGKPRTVFLTPRAKKCLIDYLESRKDNCSSLFINKRKITLPDGTLTAVPMSEFRIETISKELGKRAGLTKKCTIHIYRKTLASTLINNNCPIQVIQRILGHSSPDVTMNHYANLANKNVKQSFDHYIQY